MRLWPIVLLACGGASASRSADDPVTAHPSEQAMSDFIASRDAEITSDHAHRLVAAAVDWRRAHSNACPTTNDVVAEYTFPPGTGNDAAGTPFVLECSGPEVRALSSGRVVHVERDDPDASSGSNVSPAIAARLRACHDLALRQNPSMTGSVHGELVIARDGTVKQVVIDSKRSTVTDPELLRCIQSRLKGVASEVETHKKEMRVSF
jgi:hypothetical protein